jgi:hypothetical protein
MFKKLWLKSKEMGWYGILTLIGGLTALDFAPYISFLPDNIETPLVGIIVFVIGVAGAALRAFFREGVLTGNKFNASTPDQIKAIKEVTDIVADSPEELEEIKKAIVQVRLQKREDVLKQTFGNVPFSKEKATTNPK